MWWLETVRLESKLVQKKCCYEILIAVAYFTGDDGFFDFEIERVDRYRMSCPEMLSCAVTFISPTRLKADHALQYRPGSELDRSRFDDDFDAAILLIAKRLICAGRIL